MPSGVCLSLLFVLVSWSLSFTVNAAQLPGVENDKSALIQASNVVERAYLEILRRKPDERGFKTYVAHLLAGRSEEWLRMELRKSPEYYNRKTAQWLRVARTSGILIFSLSVSVFIVLFSQIRRNVKIMVLFIAGLCSVLYFYWIIKYAVNIPSWDDFDSILAYLNSPPFVRLQNVFSLHNEHRIAFTRLMAEFTSLLFGHVDFKFMTVAMNFSLIGILYVFWRAWDGNGLPLSWFVLFPFLVLSPQPWVNMMHPIQYSSAYLMAFVAIYLAGSDKMPRLLLAMLFATASACTNASGILTFPILLLSALLMGKTCSAPPARSAFGTADAGGLRGASCRPDREAHRDAALQQDNPRMAKAFHDVSAWPLARRSCLALILVWTLLVALLYFHNYRVPDRHALSFDTLSSAKDLVRFFFMLVGAVLGGRNYAIGAGIVMVLFFVMVTAKVLKDKSSRHHFFYLILFFLMLNAAALAIGRAGLDISALDSRYRLLSLLILCSCIGCALQYWPLFFNRHFVFIALSTLVMVGYIFSSKNVARRLEEHRKILIVETVNWLERRHGLHYPRQNMEHAGAIFDASIEEGTYVLPSCVSSLVRKADRSNVSR